MEFRTELKLGKGPFEIDHSTRIVSIGSCFADMIGSRFADSKFTVHTNPFGIIYNPISQCRLFDMDEVVTREENYYRRDGAVFNHHFHSDIFDKSIPQLKTKIEGIASDFNQYIEKADLIIFTLGTSYVYQQTTTGQIVANCHKAPSSLFTKELLEEELIIQSFKNLIGHLREKNQGLRFIFTVSPVRHIKDTIVLNSLSKSVLRLACHKICEAFENVYYFPSYELMMDDLRDYRFYKEDMIHPTKVAEDYIWNKFSDCFFTESTKDVIRSWEKVKSAIAHIPFQPDSESYKSFINTMIEQTKKLDKYFNVENELKILQKKLPR